MAETPLLEAALQYARDGRLVFPVHAVRDDLCSCRDSDCNSPGKHPRTANGLKDGTTDEAQIKAWWSRWPDANIAVVTGEVSGLSVIDFDGDEGKDSFFNHLLGKLPASRVHSTPNGRHLLFQYNPDLKQTAGALPGVDVRNDGGYVLVPPSQNGGRAYEVFRDRALAELAVVPDALRAGPSRNGASPPAIISSDNWVTGYLRTGAPLHERNNVATRLIGYYHGKGIPSDIIETQMMDFARRCDPPMDISELRRTIESVMRYQRRAEAAQIIEPPTFRLEGDDYVFDWEQHQVAILLSELFHAKDGLHARLQITTTRPGESPNVHGPVNWVLYSTSGRNSLVSYLKKRIEDLDWPSILESTVLLASRTYEEAEPVVLLSEVVPEEPRFAIDPPLVSEGETTVTFGHGNSGKSYLALAVAQAMHTGERVGPFNPLVQHRALYLDWETNAGTHKFRLQQLLRGADILDAVPDIAYLRCYLPLHEHMRQIKAAISKYSLGYVVVDSAASACGGEPEKAENALKFFNALRSLKATASVIAHSTKENSGGMPFGSVFWHNAPRATFEVIPSVDSPENEIDVGLYNRKSNNAARAKPFGLKLVFKDSSVRFDRSDIQAVPDLASRTPVKDRMQALFRSGALAVAQTAVELDVPENTIVQTLKRHKEKLFTSIPNTSPVRWGNVAL